MGLLGVGAFKFLMFTNIHTHTHIITICICTHSEGQIPCKRCVRLNRVCMRQPPLRRKTKKQCGGDKHTHTHTHEKDSDSGSSSVLVLSSSSSSVSLHTGGHTHREGEPHNSIRHHHATLSLDFSRLGACVCV